MSRYIDTDALIRYGKRGTLVYWEDIEEAPSIDIVRCKECRHKYQEPWHNGVKVEGECEIWHNATLDDDFCSYGEREGE